MASVITLEGLPSAGTTVPGELRQCTERVKAFSPTLNEDVEVCKEDLTRVQDRAHGMKRPKGRPKGTTVKRGAKKPSVTVCQTTVWVQREGKRGICKCRDKGNSQIMPHSKCGVSRATKEK